MIHKRAGAVRVIAYVEETDVDNPLGADVPYWSEVVQRCNTHPSPSGVLWEDARGWPMLAFKCQWVCSGTKGSLLSGWMLPASPPHRPGEFHFASARAVPYAIIPMGFAVDTLFWSAALWLPIRGFPACVRARRRARGVCVQCAYPVRSPDCTACPECGVVRR